MALPNVSIEIKNGGLGLTADTADGVVGLVTNGVAATGLALGVSHQGFSLAEFEALGIDSAYDTTNTVKVWRHIKEFYDEAGTGAELWIMLVSQATTMQSICDKTQAFAKKLIDDSQGRIKVLGVARNPAGGYTTNTTANQIDLDVISALTTAQSLADDLLAAFRPVRFVLDGYGYTGNSSTLVNLKAQTKANCAILIGNSETGARNAVGLLLGRLAKIPVQRNPGRVKDGALAITAAFLGTATLESNPAAAGAIHDKGFITLRQYSGKAGYYFSDDPTAVAATNDLSSLARCRVLDKAVRIAYSVFVEEILDEVLINATTGQILAVRAKYYQTIIETAINNQMTANSEISGVTVLVDPEQNVLSTGKICIDLRIVPVGYAKEIKVTLGFYNPANA